MQVRLKTIMAQDWRTLLPGMVAEFEDKEAKRLINRGLAEPFKPMKKKENATRKVANKETRVA